MHIGVKPVGGTAFLTGTVWGIVVLSGHFWLLGVLVGTSIQTEIFYSPCACVCEACGYAYMHLVDMEKYKGGWPYYWISSSKVLQFQFFGLDFMIWQGFGLLGESQVDSGKDCLKRKFGECPLYFFWGI